MSTPSSSVLTPGVSSVDETLVDVSVAEATAEVARILAFIFSAEGRHCPDV